MVSSVRFLPVFLLFPLLPFEQAQASLPAKISGLNSAAVECGAAVRVSFFRGSQAFDNCNLLLKADSGSPEELQDVHIFPVKLLRSTWGIDAGFTMGNVVLRFDLSSLKEKPVSALLGEYTGGGFTFSCLGGIDCFRLSNRHDVRATSTSFISGFMAGFQFSRLSIYPKDSHSAVWKAFIAL